MLLRPDPPECEAPDDSSFNLTDENVGDENRLTIEEEFKALQYPLPGNLRETLEKAVEEFKSNKVDLRGQVAAFFIATRVCGWEASGNTYWHDTGWPVGDIRSFDPTKNQVQAKKVCKILGISYPGDPATACIKICEWYKIHGKSFLAFDKQRIADFNNGKHFEAWMKKAHDRPSLH